MKSSPLLDKEKQKLLLSSLGLKHRNDETLASEIRFTLFHIATEAGIFETKHYRNTLARI